MRLVSPDDFEKAPPVDESLERFLEGQHRFGVLPDWMCSQIELPSLAHVAEATLMDLHGRGPELVIEVKEKAWAATFLRELLEQQIQKRKDENGSSGSTR